MPFGTLKTDEVKHGIPVHSPPYPSSKDEFSDIDALVIRYRTSAAAVKGLLPQELEIEDEPIAVCTLFKYGMSPIGAYTEFVSHIEVRFQGVKYNYCLELILDNEGAIFSGREKYGIPKVFGSVAWDPTSTKPAPAGFVAGHVERPAGVKLAQFGFKPEAKVQGFGPIPRLGQSSLGLRSIPSPVIGDPPVVREFVPFEFQITEGEVWRGTGSLAFTGVSEFDPLHKVPVVRYESATLIRRASAVLHPATKTFSI